MTSASLVSHFHPNRCKWDQVICKTLSYCKTLTCIYRGHSYVDKVKDNLHNNSSLTTHFCSLNWSFYDIQLMAISQNCLCLIAAWEFLWDYFLRCINALKHVEKQGVESTGGDCVHFRAFLDTAIIERKQRLLLII